MTEKILNALSDIIDTHTHPINSADYRLHCKSALDAKGALILPNFLTHEAIAIIQKEGIQEQKSAFYTKSSHTVYLLPPDSNFPEDHIRNRQIHSSKGCITTDQIPQHSPLHTLYEDTHFKSFLCSILGEQALYPYADSLSSINLHYASAGQELGWHYDHSSFAITLLIQKPQQGGNFEFVRNVRDADKNEMAFENTRKILDKETNATALSFDVGDLVLFRGRNSIHRVTATEGDTTRMLVVLAYNTAPGIALSESARKTFFGRVGEVL
ncbi:MAG: 2OG-Fe(II) oxygenase [Proteobacteria bacterium]|nr:2OG-Fe(II) oxygenase [Pseudomonadota bacterium]